MKKIIVFLILLISFADSSYSRTANTEKLVEIEKSYYGYSRENENIGSRLSRLEKMIYGSESNKSESERISRLYDDLGIGITGDSSASLSNDGSSVMDIGPEADAGIKYPVVDKIEEKVFNKSYPNDEIYSRLARIEKQVYKKESTKSLNERVDALRSKVLGGSQLATAEINPETEEIILQNGQKYYGEGLSNYNYYSYEHSKTRVPDIQSSPVDKSDDILGNDSSLQNYDLDLLEKSLFGRQYSNETSSQRLSRLESKVFERTFSDGEDSRIQRLLAVTTAQKTSQEYDSNKWARRINTGMQIGSILLMVLAMIL